MYAVVEFLEECAVEAVPQSWVQNNKNICFWPPYGTKDKDVKQLIKKRRVPDVSWRECKIALLKENIGDYQKARYKAKKASSGKEMTTDAENLGRGKRKRALIEQSSDSSSEEEESPMLQKMRSLLPKHPESSTSATKSTEQLMIEDDVIIQENTNTPKRKIPGLFPDVFSSTNKDLEAVLKELVFINAKLDRHSELLNLLSARQSATIPSLPLANLDEIVDKFPIKNEADALCVEKALQDKSVKKNLQIKLKCFGGSTPADHTRRILKYIFTNEFSENYSWHGNKGKSKFSSLHISNVIIDAVVEEYKESRSAVENTIKNWLRHSKERRLYCEKKENSFAN